MKRFAHKRGSVLMELIIVMPVYIVLLAGTFMLGDSLVFGTRLAHSERCRIFDGSTGADIDRRNFYADTRVEGAWTLRTDIKETGRYKLPAYGIAGMLLFGDQTFEGKKEKGKMRMLIDGGTVSVYSKDNGDGRAYKYNVYMLRRNRDLNGGMSWRDNRRHSSQLLCSRDNGGNVEVWKKHVRDEKWHEVINDGAHGNGSLPFPSESDVSAYYTRYGGFMTLLGEEN